MQGMAYHQHHRDLHAGRRQYEDDDHDFIQDGGGVHGSEEVTPQVHTTKSQLEGELLLPFIICRLPIGVTEEERIATSSR